MLRWLLLPLLLTSCLQPYTPDATTKYTEITGAPMSFILNVDQYIEEVNKKMPDCGIEVKPDLIAFVFFQDIGSLYGAQYKAPRTIVINSKAHAPIALFGHEYCRELLFTTGNEQWAQPSSNWNVQPIGCCWNTVETISLKFDYPEVNL